MGLFSQIMMACIIIDDTIDDFQSIERFVSESSKSQWYLILVVNPNTSSKAAQEFFKNYQYLNLRTGDVKFYLPGLTRDNTGGTHVIKDSLIDYGLPEYRYDYEKFAKAIEWLESKCEGYKFSEGADLLFLQSKKINGTYVLDYDNFIEFNIDSIDFTKNNVNRFIQDVKRLIDSNPNNAEILKLLGQHKEDSISTKEFIIFIAGSKELANERNQVRAQIQQINNARHMNFKTFTYEDFNRSIVNGGQQNEYNQFIKSKTDYAIFLIDKKVGGITYEEFQTALNAYLLYGKPSIYVYHNPGNRIDKLFKSKQVKDIIRLINLHKQYYIPYKDISELGHLIYRDFSLIPLTR